MKADERTSSVAQFHVRVEKAPDKTGLNSFLLLTEPDLRYGLKDVRKPPRKE